MHNLAIGWAPSSRKPPHRLTPRSHGIPWAADVACQSSHTPSGVCNAQPLMYLYATKTKERKAVSNVIHTSWHCCEADDHITSGRCMSGRESMCPCVSCCQRWRKIATSIRKPSRIPFMDLTCEIARLLPCQAYYRHDHRSRGGLGSFCTRLRSRWVLSRR